MPELIAGKYEHVGFNGGRMFSTYQPNNGGVIFHELEDRSTRSIARELGGAIWHAYQNIHRRDHRRDHPWRTAYLSILWHCGVRP